MSVKPLAVCAEMHHTEPSDELACFVAPVAVAARLVGLFRDSVYRRASAKAIAAALAGVAMIVRTADSPCGFLARLTSSRRL